MRIYRRQIERITITGKMSEVSKAFDYCLDNHFHTVRSGPKPINKYRIDVSKFLIIAERKVIKS